MSDFETALYPGENHISRKCLPELVPKLIDYALKRMVRTFGSMEQAHITIN
jgi:hypothetical protein